MSKHTSKKSSSPSRTKDDAPTDDKSRSSTSPQRSAMGKRHPKSRSKSSSSFAKELPLWLLKPLGLLVLPVVLGIFGYQLHHQYVVLPAQVNTPSDLPKVLSEDFFDVARSPERYWGSYRANLYFGLRTRHPKSPVFGLMWYEQPRQTDILMPQIRHWCNQEDGLHTYGWIEHDGADFGRQILEDKNVLVDTAFVKQPGGAHGGDWTARIKSTPNPKSLENSTLHSFIVYLALGSSDTDGSYLKPHLTGAQYLEYIDYIDGYTPELGSFKLRFLTKSSPNVVSRGFLATRMEPQVPMEQLKEVVIAGTGIIKIKSQHIDHYLGLIGHAPSQSPPTEKPNFLALQVTFLSGTQFDVAFESGSVKNRSHVLTGANFDKALAVKRHEFAEKFESIFGLKQKQYAVVYEEMGKLALSNMLGSISYFHGYAKVISPYNKKSVLYGPHTLMSTIPSRSFFPRGFLWDEGFHQLLLKKWDPELSLEILGSWLDLMNVEGWIPRELILGPEAEVRVPPEFVIQHDDVANPPMFFYLLGKFLENEKLAEDHKDYFKKVYPRLRLWFDWLNGTQNGAELGTYRWRGRNATTTRELNPKTLPSGLDDYPRASHPSMAEYHVDLYCWMAVSAKTVHQLAKLAEESNGLRLAKVGETAEFLADPARLQQLHWSEKSSRFCDFGLHTRHVKLERPKPQIGQDGRPLPQQNNEMFRAVLRDPQERLVSDTLGYVSLFPLFLRLLPHDSPKLPSLLSQMEDQDLLWSRFGLRSLAKTSPLYGERNTEHDPPYWRGSIWMNMNYLALSSLHHYSQFEGPYRAKAFELYGKLRGAVVANVLREFARTGYLWEHYNDETGQGEGSHPFTGWTSLVLLMMSEQYD